MFGAVVPGGKPDLGDEPETRDKPEMGDRNQPGDFRAFEEARSRAKEAHKWLSEYFPLWKASFEICVGSPARELVNRAELSKANLLVVGSHGRSTLGRLVLGSVSSRVVAEAGCSVRVSKPRQDGVQEPIKIIVGVDGSPGSDAALDAVVRRHWPVETEVLLVTAVDTIRPTAVGSLIPQARSAAYEYNDEEMACAKQMQAAASARLNAAGLKVITLAVPGDPKHLLVDEASRWAADTIFVGARGLNSVSRLLLGSVSTAVASRAYCSVEIVRA
jgi:nucleotide-binding universal stress UspA family protein